MHVFWTSFEYIIGKEEFEKSFSKQIAKFYSAGEVPNLSLSFTILIVLLISVANKPH
jgi:hypothetical protein